MEHVPLYLALLVLSVNVAVLTASVPFLWWKAQELERKVMALDEVLSTLLEASGVGKQQKGG